ncbi:MAG TPA: hypothetical protein VGM20_04220 [Gemmatimonadales bacterium]
MNPREFLEGVVAFGATILLLGGAVQLIRALLDRMLKPMGHEKS